MYRKKNFVIPLLAEDVVLKIRDEFGNVKKIITDGFANIVVKSNYLIVKQRADTKPTELDFPTNVEAREASVILSDALKKLAANRKKELPAPGGNVDDELCGDTVGPVLRSRIWTQSNLIPTPAPEADSGVVVYVEDLELDPVANVFAFNASGFTEIVPTGVHSTYAVVVKTAADEIIPAGWNGMHIDYACGYVKFNTYTSSSDDYLVNADNPVKVTFHKYVGELGNFDTSAYSYVLFSPDTDGQVLFDLNLGTIVDARVYVNGVRIKNLLVDDQYEFLAGGDFQWNSTDFELETTDSVEIEYR